MTGTFRKRIMHRSILGVPLVASARGGRGQPRRQVVAGLALAWIAASNGALAVAATPAAAPCPGPQAVVLERFTSADCSDCWQADHAPVAGTPWLFDWISPTTPEAPMSAAAPGESRERALRAGGPAPVGQQMLVARSTVMPPRGLRLAVQSGPAWSGYIGLQLSVGGRVPPGASGWMALVEQIPAGSEGSTVRRDLVRAVAGPLPLVGVRAGQPLTHLAALRWPETAKPERLVARAWLEAADGRMLAVASEPCPRR